MNRLRDSAFRALQVPSFAAQDAMRRLHEKVPEYRYRESSLFPTDVSDRANDWEAGLFREFQSNPELRELVGESGTEGYCLSSPSSR